ncbi:toprim domain-containing protein [Lysinibacillus sp. 54212]|uniref:toprim domain-containing protein n=1 Tax=Lysinibacillus sp. 54212 TaxID=3119829 RepID=UPI002FC96DC0
MDTEKCIIVEGRSDKLKIAPLFAEDVAIVCTNGTVDEEVLIDIIEPFEQCDLFTLFDADKSGDRLRKTMKRCYSEATQLTIPKQYLEVAKTPADILTEILRKAKFMMK